jgi:hypothetical protein
VVSRISPPACLGMTLKQPATPLPSTFSHLIHNHPINRRYITKADGKTSLTKQRLTTHHTKQTEPACVCACVCVCVCACLRPQTDLIKDSRNTSYFLWICHDLSHMPMDLL